MKAERTPLILVLASLLALTAVGSRAVAQGPGIATKSYSVTAGKMEVSLEVPTEPVVLAAFTFSITVTNRDSVPIEVLEIGSRPVFVISVFTKDGRECVRTPAGENINGPGPVHGFSTANIVIAPGKSHTWRIPLQDIFVLQPGKYKMTIGFATYREKEPRKGGGIEFTIQG